MLRTHAAGSLRTTDAGQKVTLAGWVARRRDHGGVIFIDLRDASGVSQVVFREGDVLAQAHRLRAEFCIAVDGVVEIRPEGNANPEIATGEIEVNATSLTVLGESAPLPFQLDETAGEEARLKYRYLDLRREGPGNAIRLRSKVNAAARGVLAEHDFVEIETPTMTRSTPEGARDFLVPARLQPGQFYALPAEPAAVQAAADGGGHGALLPDRPLLPRRGLPRRSPARVHPARHGDELRRRRRRHRGVRGGPQGAVGADRLRRCRRRSRGSRTPTRCAGSAPTSPTCGSASNWSSAPSTSPTPPFGFSRRRYVGAVVMPGGASQPRRTLDGWQEFAKQRGHRGLAYVLVAEDGTLGGPVAKNLSDAERDGLAAHVGAEPGDCIFFAAGPAKSARALLGATRIEIAKRLDLIDPAAWAFTWVVDWPLFEAADEATAAGDVAVGSGAWTAVHHAFTSPKPESEATFDTDPGNALANAYDIVCNGNEIGGGSIRIHRRDVQERVFAMMGIDHAEAQDKFGFLLDAFTFGAPPARRHRVRLGPHHRAAGRHGLDPRGHRVPEVRRRRRPADRCARADHPAAAQGIGNRRQAGEA